MLGDFFLELLDMCLAREAEVDDRGYDQREKHGDEQASNDGDGQRLEHLRSGAKRKGEREHAGDGRKRSHQNGTKPAASGLQYRFFGGKSFGAEAALGIKKKNPVLGDDADDHDEAHKGGYAEGRTGDEQRAHHSRSRTEQKMRGWQ